MSKKTSLLLVLCIVALAAFFRFSALDRIPPGIYPDEAIKGNEGIEAVRTGDFKIFYPANNGREGLWINMIGLSVSLFGANQFGLRVWSALAGTLTVLFLYLLAKELFPSRERIAPFSAFMLATSFWHMNFSRIAFRAILVPFLMTASLYFLLRAWRSADEAKNKPQATNNKKISLVICYLLFAICGGILYGLGFHTYIAFRFTPFIIGAFFIFEFIRRLQRDEALKKWLAVTGLWLGMAFLTALPIGLYFLHHPQDFFGRAGGVSVFSAENPLKEFGIVAIKTAGMFNIRGDCNWRHNMACAPQLILPVGLLFLLGFWLGLKKLKTDRLQAASYILLFVWFFVLLLPELLTREGIPHALRAIGVIPPVFIFAALGADWLLERIRNKELGIRKFLASALVVIIIVSGAVEAYRYFGVWTKNKNTEGAFTHRLVEIGRYLNSLPAETPRYVVVNDPGVFVWHVNPDGGGRWLPMPAQTVLYVTQGHPQATYLVPEDVLHTNFPPGSVIIPLLPSESVFAGLRNRGLEIREERRQELTIDWVK